MPSVEQVLSGPMEKGDHCAAWLRSGILYVHSLVYTSNGLLLAWPPYLAVPVRTPDALLGKLVRLVLRESQLDGPEPPPPKNYLEIGPLQRLADAKSWRAFERGARLVNIERRRESLTLLPNRQRASGYTCIGNGEQVLAANISDSELGVHVRQMFKLCELRNDA